MNTQLKEYNRRQDETDKNVEKNQKRIEDVNKLAKENRREIRNQRETLEEMEARIEKKMREELRERENRKLNLIMHGVPELGANITSNKDRMEKDKVECERIFIAMGARTRAQDLRFCRRIGERGENPRPIVFGVDWETVKKHLLEKARELRHTNYDSVTIVPDLTKSQRRDEQDLRDEADQRNGQLTADDRAKNLKWLVVGHREEEANQGYREGISTGT